MKLSKGAIAAGVLLVAGIAAAAFFAPVIAAGMAIGAAVSVATLGFMAWHGHRKLTANQLVYTAALGGALGIVGMGFVDAPYIMSGAGIGGMADGIGSALRTVPKSASTPPEPVPDPAPAAAPIRHGALSAAGRLDAPAPTRGLVGALPK